MDFLNNFANEPTRYVIFGRGLCLDAAEDKFTFLHRARHAVEELAHI